MVDLMKWPNITLNDWIFILVNLQIRTTTGFADVPIIPGKTT